jgi:hypothetical protein
MSNAQSVVLALVLAIAFFELGVTGKLRDLWTVAFTPNLGGVSGGKF